MKKPLITQLAAAIPAVALLVSVMPADAKDLTALERKEILEQIEAIEKKLNDSKGKNNASAMATFKAALGSPQKTYQYFMECSKKIHFTEKGKSAGEYGDWRRENEDKLRDSSHVSALQLQLQYLILSIRAGEAETEEEFAKVLPDLGTYLGKMTAGYENLTEPAKKVIRANALSSVFAEVTKVDKTIKKNEKWTYSPRQVGAIYDKIILAYYRKNKDASGLARAWNQRIAQETAIETASTKITKKTESTGRTGGRRNGISTEKLRELRKEARRDDELEKKEFKTDVLPGLLWQKARDLFIYSDDKAKYINEMGSLIKTNLANERASSWLNEMKSFLSQDFKPEDFYPEDGISSESEED